MNHLPLKLFHFGLVADVASFRPRSGDHAFKRCAMGIVTGDTCSRADRPMDKISFTHLRMALSRGTGSTGNHFVIGERLSLQVMTILALFFSPSGGGGII